MASIKKRNTSALNHIPAPLISTLEVRPETKEAYVLFSQRGPAGVHETVLPITRDAYARACSMGHGSNHPNFRGGLVGKSRFQYVVLTEDMPTADGGAKEVQVVGIHAYPNSNYVNADWTSELKKPVEDNTAIVQVHPDTGEMEIVAYPARAYRSIESFLRELEKLEEITDSTQFAAGSWQCTVVGIFGNEVTITMQKKARPDLTAM